MNDQDLTQGSILKNLLRFSIPFLISCFLQTLYGLVDLFIIGQFNSADAITAVSVGSQVMHMVTVILVGFCMGITVLISHAKGAKENDRIRGIIANSILLFSIIAIVGVIGTLTCIDGIISVLEVPVEAINGTREYLFICFIGIIFITAYNVLCSIFRGLGDSRTPMYFVAIAGVINIGLDYVAVGVLHMGAKGAAIATIAAQAISVILALIYSAVKVPELKISPKEFKINNDIIKGMLKVGFPIAIQDGLIQVAFLVITVIANMRGVDTAAAVGIVEKVICFMFLVPSAMLSSVSTIASANLGAKKPERGRKTLFCAIAICSITGLIFIVLSLFKAEDILRLFAKEEELVILMGGQYLRAYVFDTIAAGIHFCFSGYFCAYNKSWISFVHNIISIVVVRIPGAYLASVYFPQTLLPMGMAAPLGSLLSAFICIGIYIWMRKKEAQNEN